jgi:hypothetical protein
MVDSVAASAPDGPRFAIGRALALSFGVLGRNLGPMAAISLAVTAVQSGVDYMLSGGTGGDRSNSFTNLISYALITAPVTYATFQDLRGTPGSMGSIFSKSFGIIWRVAGATIGVVLIAIVPALIVVVAGATVGLSLVLLAALAGIFVLSIFVVWFVLVPVLVVEDIRFFAGFGRALDLTRGRRWSILGLLLVYGVMIVAIGAVMLGLVAMFQDSVIVSLVLLIPFSAFYSVIGAILPAVVYYLLRAEKEGVGIDQIAMVFD